MTDKLTVADVLRIVADAVWKPREGATTVYGEEATLAGIAHRLRDEAARREAVCLECGAPRGAICKKPTCPQLGLVPANGQPELYKPGAPPSPAVALDHEGSEIEATPRPADDLVERLRFSKGALNVADAQAMREAAAAIEALRAENKGREQQNREDGALIVQLNARVAAMTKALLDVIATDHHNLSDGPPPRYVTIARNALAAGGQNG